MYTICFTGHRPKSLYGYNESLWIELRDALMQKVIIPFAQQHGNQLRVITGGAQGVDQTAYFAARCVKDSRPDLTIVNDVFIPFQGQELKWPLRTMFGQDCYNAMIRLADSVTDVSAQKHLSHNDYRSAVSCLMARNAAMIDASDCVIAVYAHGTDYETAKGGTADAIRTAVRRGKPCIIFDPHKLCCSISINQKGDSL